MRINNEVEQMTLSDVGLWSGRMCRAHSQATVEPISKPSSKKQPKLSKQTLISLNLRKVDGHMPDTSWGTDTQWLGGCMIVNGGVYPRDARGSAWLPISTDTPQCPSYLILDMGEKPNEPMPTKLSEILQEEADPKYNLSARACQGILNRASRRGKALPEILKQALEAQAVEN